MAQLLPILLFFAFTLLPGIFEREPPYVLHRTNAFGTRTATAGLGVPFYVKGPNHELFDKSYPPDSQKRARIEQEIEYEYKARAPAPSGLSRPARVRHAACVGQLFWRWSELLERSEGR